jgi:hypothetical protein
MQIERTRGREDEIERTRCTSPKLDYVSVSSVGLLWKADMLLSGIDSGTLQIKLIKLNMHIATICPAWRMFGRQHVVERLP